MFVKQLKNHGGKSALLLALMLASASAFAGGGGEDFMLVWQELSDWTQGYLGQIIAGAMILVGVIAGIARQSLMAFAIGIAAGLGLNFAPDIIEGLMGASAMDVSPLTLISNGLIR